MTAFYFSPDVLTVAHLALLLCHQAPLSHVVCCPPSVSFHLASSSLKCFSFSLPLDKPPSSNGSALLTLGIH